MVMSKFKLKFLTLAWNEAETFIKMLKHEVDYLLDLCLKVLKKKIIISRVQLFFGLEKAIVYFRNFRIGI